MKISGGNANLSGLKSLGFALGMSCSSSIGVCSLFVGFKAFD